MVARKMRSVEERFWEKVDKTDSCWLWTGSKQHNGYGFFHVGGKAERMPYRAHRLSWEIHNGPIPDGMWVLHRCDTPACVNPAHLFLGDRTDNMRDCAEKGRICTVGKSRLTHCLRGHEFTPENTRITVKGHRKCRICNRANARASYAIRARGAKERGNG